MSKILEFQDLVDSYLWDNPHVTNGYAAEQVAKNILRYKTVKEAQAALDSLETCGSFTTYDGQIVSKAAFYKAVAVAKEAEKWQKVSQIREALETLPYGKTEFFGVAGSVWEEKRRFIVDNNGASQEFTTALEAAIQIAAILQSESEE